MPRRPLDEIDREIAVSLRRLRRERGLTQQALGEILGVSGQQVAKYEAAHDRLAARQLIMLTRALDITLDRFLQNEIVD